MPKLKRELAFEDMNIMEFVNQLADGRFLVPSFQREFIWEPQNIINLWDSIYRFYPIGTILYWDTDIRLNIHRRLGGFIIAHDDEAMKKREGNLSYILDGQQRATALLVALFGGRGNVKDHRDFDYTMYFDATSASFFFAHEFNRRSLEVNPAFLIRLRDVHLWQPDFYKRIALEQGFKKMISANLHRLARTFMDYRVLLIRIKGFDIRGVCEIFERINQEGKRLKNIDLLISRNFHNYSSVVEEDWNET
jgi:hypothetical protein